MKISAEVKALALVTEEEQQDFVKWMWRAKDRNNFDMAIMSYPRTVMFRTFDAAGTTLFLPAHPVLMFESLCSRPELNEKATALSLWRIGELANDVMKDVGMHESYFITNDKAEADSCEKHGWIKLLHDPEKGEWLMKHRTKEAPDAT